MTTYAQLVTAVSGMSVTGVVRKFAYEPDSVQTTDMPISYVRFPSGTRPGEISTCFMQGTSKSIEAVYVIDAGGQNTAAANFAAKVAMADNIETAVETLAATFSSEFLTYTLTDESSPMDTTGYHAIVLTVTLTRV